MRASRGLKWENKMYKPKRAIDHIAFYQSSQVVPALLGLAAFSFVPTKYMQ